MPYPLRGRGNREGAFVVGTGAPVEVFELEGFTGDTGRFCAVKSSETGGLADVGATYLKNLFR